MEGRVPPLGVLAEKTRGRNAAPTRAGCARRGPEPCRRGKGHAWLPGGWQGREGGNPREALKPILKQSGFQAGCGGGDVRVLRARTRVHSIAAGTGAQSSGGGVGAPRLGSRPGRARPAEAPAGWNRLWVRPCANTLRTEPRGSYLLLVKMTQRALSQG